MKPITKLSELKEEIAVARQRVAQTNQAQRQLFDSLPLKIAGIAGLWAVQAIIKQATPPPNAAAEQDLNAEKNAATEPGNLKTRLVEAGQETLWFAIEKLIAALLKK